MSGLLIGRNAGPDRTSPDRLGYAEALGAVLGDRPFPVIYAADVGHVPPQMTLLNGAHARITGAAGRGEVVQAIPR